jgi:hypothetical protein
MPSLGERLALAALGARRQWLNPWRRRRWEYLTLEIEALRDAGIGTVAMWVTTSDGRYDHTSMPNEPMAVLNELGADGWDMVECGGPTAHGYTIPVPDLDVTGAFYAMFKRRVTED